MPHASYPRTKKGTAALIFGHSLLHTYWYRCLKGKCPKNWCMVKIRYWHEKHIRMMKQRGIKHNSPLLKYVPRKKYG